MINSWKELLFGNLAAPVRNAIVGGPFGSNLVSKDYVESGVPVIRGQNMVGRWVGGDFVFVSDGKAKSLSGNLARPGDLIFTQRGTLGQVAIVPEGPYERYLVSQSQMKATVDAAHANVEFLYYFFSSGAQQEWIRSNAIQTGVPHINLGILKKHPILLPSLREQESIAAVLGSLDEKIEQNRRTARNLEALARATFKAWFVNFEPVRAKAAGATSFPGMPDAVFAVLPSDLADSPFGPVPQGWGVGKLGEHCGINERSVRVGQIRGEIEYIDIASVTVGRLDGVQRLPFAEAPSRARRRVRHGDTIWSCVRPNRRSYLFLHSPAENCIVSTGFAVLSPASFGPSYLHELTTRQEFVDYLVSNADGSAYPAVRPDHFAAADVLVPPAELRDVFEEVTMPVRDLLAAGNAESAKLAALRDYLLPRLLSGQVRVREAERAVEDAA